MAEESTGAMSEAEVAAMAAPDTLPRLDAPVPTLDELTQASHDAPVVEAAAEAPQTLVEREPNPGTEVWVDLSAMGTYVIVAAPNGQVRAREIVVDGVTCEHCDEGAGGVWRYRRRL